MQQCRACEPSRTFATVQPLQCVLASNTNDANTLHTNGPVRTTILVVDDDTTARLTISARRRWRYVPIIAVTRLDNPQVRADLLNAGADAIAAKPINAAELRAMVYAAARTRRLYQNLMRGGS